jgi:hypothetical protein
MQGNLHVRFGEGDEEAYPGDGARRFIPTLPACAAELVVAQFVACKRAVQRQGP